VSSRARPAVLAIALLALAAAPAAGAHDFDHPASHDPAQQFAYGRPLGPGNVQRQDVPHDPDYDQSEPDAPFGRTSLSLFDERFDLFGFPSQLTPLAGYRAGPHVGKSQIAGFNAAGAWKVTRGKPSVAIAILDTGIKWDRAGLRDQIRLNRGELPKPEDASGHTHHTYDLNANGRLDVDDYAHDPRVSLHWKGRHGPKGEITAEDLIHAFSNGRDEDHNGYVDDIAGWDFFDNDNDPYDSASYFAAKNHGSARAEQAAEQGNDGKGSIGVCPGCQILPIRTWDSFVSDANTFGLGILYATDNGAAVIEGANGSIYHSAFSQFASNYAYRHGAAQIFSGDDLNTADHNYPGNYSHTQLIQGTVPDTVGLGKSLSPELAKLLGGLPLGTEVPTLTFFRGANETQYGAHSSVSMEGPTGSDNTAKAAGAAGMVISAARERGIRLGPDETREILEQTAEDVLGPNTIGVGTPDPAVPGFDTHFGYGRVDLGAAVGLAHSGAIPPQASIAHPDWYAPLTARHVEITGRARARFAPGGRFHWKLQWGVGPSPGAWHTAGQGDGTGTVRHFGSIDLDAVRAALAHSKVPHDPGGPTFARGEPSPFARRFTVRLLVSAPGLRDGMDRRTFNAIGDPTLLPGSPRRLGTGGEAPLRYADLNGDGVQELIVPGEDGLIRALEPDGSELSGWPVRTRRQLQAHHHAHAPGVRRSLRARAGPREPPRGAAVADLDGDGRPEVIDAAGIHLYVWEPDGHLRKGFPVSMDLSHCGPNPPGVHESQPNRHQKCGFFGSPALGHLEGPNKPLDIVEAGLDGWLYAFQPDGRSVPGFPRHLVDPGEPAYKQVYAGSINDPAIADLNGDGHDDVVVSTNESYSAVSPGVGALIHGGLESVLYGLLGQIGGSTRVYAVSGATGKLLPGWPIKLNSLAPGELPLIGPGQDASIARIGGRPTVVVSTTLGPLAEYGADGKLIRGMQQITFGARSDATDRTVALNLFENAVVGRLDPTEPLDVVKYAVTLSQALNLVLAGQNFAYNHLIGAYDATTGNTLPAWPTVTDDYQLVSSSNVAKIDPSREPNQVVTGTGLGLLHAYDGATGHDVAGFPKRTGGWLFAPAALADDGRLAAMTREGYLFQWHTSAPACQPEWPNFRHDDHQTGDYDTDGTAPSAPGDLRAEPVGRGHRRYRVSFTAPGDDHACGHATGYRAWVDGHRRALRRLGAPPADGSPVAQTLVLGGHARTLRLAAVDDAGNVGPAATVRLRPRRSHGGG
jgi:hypothetical protein